ncbi:MAG: ABC transporter permease [Bacteroidales bacterium]|nr:ABC transporter permease [Bacteroidales bacterium]
MFIHYLITAWRYLLKNRWISFINILGLTLGLASAVIAIAFALHELTYEECHEKSDRISAIYLSGKFGDIDFIPSTFGPEGEALQDMFPEIESYTITRNYATTVRAGENLFIEDDITFADSMFFQIFTIPFKMGHQDNDPQSIVISEQAAIRYFGREVPLGKNLRINCNGEQVDFTVTGVFDDLPSNTQIITEFIIPMRFSSRFGYWKYQEYQSTSYSTYVLLKSGADLKDLNEKIRRSYKIPSPIENISAYLLPLKEIHFKGTYENTKGKLQVFLFGGLFVLLISCLNYINFINILFSSRIRETGVRKVNGANKIHVFLQLLTDTFLTTLISFNLAVVLLKLTLPRFNASMNTNLHITADQHFLIAGLLLFIVVTVISGFYPALKFSSAKPISLMKNSNSAQHSGLSSRNILTTLQLFLSIVFIQLIMVMDKQATYMYSRDITRYDGSNVICVNGYPWGDLRKVKDELKKNPDVLDVSWGSTIPSMGYNLTLDWKEKNNTTFATWFNFDPDYLNVFGIKMVAGRFFSDIHPSDKENGVVINEKTAHELGFTDPIGKTVQIRDKAYTIIGVVDAYQAVPPIVEITPFLITYSNYLNEYLVIRINPHKKEATHTYIINILRKFNADYPVEIKYHNEVLMDTKEGKSYITAGRMLHVFFLLTLINSLIGVFGLSLFIAQRFRKQIGIRKVFGANISGIMFKLSKGLIIQTFIAAAIASPLSWYGSRAYLSVFPHRIEPGVLFFVLGGILMLTMLLATVSWQVWKAAVEDPVNSLRYE